MNVLPSAPVVSPTDVEGYGGRNGEIFITWTVGVFFCTSYILKV